MGTHPETLALFTRDLEASEGLRLSAYRCTSGKPTIGIGMTRYPNGVPVSMGDQITESVARAMCSQLIAQEYLPACAKLPGWASFGKWRQVCLLSFAYNLGAGFFGAEGFETISRILREGVKNPAAYSGMRKALALYNKNASGAVDPGLVNRRAHEANLWEKEDDGVIELKATQDTFLKKSPIAAEHLSATGKVAMSKGSVIQVSRLESIAKDAHAWASIIGRADGPWAIYQPHWTAAASASDASKPITAVAAAPAGKPPGKVNWNDFNAKISQYLTVGEVLQWDARRKPASGSSAETNALAMAKQFDLIRAAWGGALTITSGIRPEPINRQVGGVANSMHVPGKALDITPSDGRLDEFYKWIVKRWTGGVGDGRNKGFIHLDTRDNGKFDPRGGASPAAVWLY